MEKTISMQALRVVGYFKYIYLFYFWPGEAVMLTENPYG